MGQGHYTALVWGVTGDECGKINVEVDGYSEVAEWADDAIYGRDAFVKSSYESKIEWLGAFVGCSDPNVAERRTSDAAELEYTAMDIASVPTLYANEIDLARKDWEKFRALAAEHGVTLPEGELLLVFDYD